MFLLRHIYNRYFSFFTERLKDFGIVMRPLWVILLFQLLITVAFVSAPQGQDMLLTFIIDFDTNWFSLGWFWLALFCLSVASEFGSRLIMYFSDLTTHELEDRRVRFRKVYQKTFSKIFLFAPVVAITWGFMKAYMRLREAKAAGIFEYRDPLIIFIIILTFLFALALLLYQIYFGRWRKWLYRLPLSRLQQYMLTKLYSISKERWIQRVKIIDGIQKKSGSTGRRLWFYETLAQQVLCSISFTRCGIDCVL